jgi:hypothetical protein
MLGGSPLTIEQYTSKVLLSAVPVLYIIMRGLPRTGLIFQSLEV